MLNTTTINWTKIEEMAIQCAMSTLKRIDATTDDPKVREMLLGLKEDLYKIGNPYYAVSEAKTGYKVSDGYDCFLVAYNFLADKAMEYMSVDNDWEEENLFYIEEDRILASGKVKTRTVFQWACTEVRQHIYKYGQRDFKRIYVECKPDKDGNATTEAETMDSMLYQVGRYYDIDNERGVVVYENLLKACEGLTARQKLILHYRLQGKSGNEIAEILKVKHNTISSHLKAIQEKIRKAYPEAVAVCIDRVAKAK